MFFTLNKTVSVPVPLPVKRPESIINISKSITDISQYLYSDDYEGKITYNIEKVVLGTYQLGHGPLRNRPIYAFTKSMIL